MIGWNNDHRRCGSYNWPMWEPRPFARWLSRAWGIRKAILITPLFWICFEHCPQTPRRR